MKNTRPRLLVLCALCSVALVTPLANHAQDDKAALPLFKPKVKALAAFKNGLGFCVATGQAELKDGWTVLDHLPPAALGTLWIATSGQSGAVTEIIAYKERLGEESPALTHSRA